MKTAVDSLFLQLGQPVKYKNNTIRLILIEPDKMVGVGFVNTHSSSHQGQIRISDAPNLKIGDKIETDTDTGKVKHNMLSAVMGTWDGFVNHRGKAATLTWGEGRIKG